MSTPSATVRIHLPAVLRPLAGGRAEARAEGHTVGEVLRALGRAHPGLAERVLDAEGCPRRYLTLFLNDEDVRALSGTETPVHEGDELTLVPAIAGGAPCR